ncbi:MAG: hypothetical protein M1819_000385 [Sarea resinae]|nr:MAG: hypothetical protein M1819_000385 [Sarea resinae]
MPIEVTPLTEEDIPGAIDTIQLAFADDPYNRWIFNDRSKYNLTRNRASLGIRCRWGIRNALFYVAKDPASSTPSKVLGTAMWMPPRRLDAPVSWDEWMQGWWLWARQVGMNAWYGRGGLNVKRYYLWKSSQATLQSAIWTNPSGYYFCNIVTVLPSAQGRGIGKRLFQKVTEKADAEGLPCYLESSRDVPNVAIYERLGFRLVREMVLEEGGEACKLFCMIRDPQPASKKEAKAPAAATTAVAAVADLDSVSLEAADTSTSTSTSTSISAPKTEMKTKTKDWLEEEREDGMKGDGTGEADVKDSKTPASTTTTTTATISAAPARRTAPSTVSAPAPAPYRLPSTQDASY